MSRTQRTAAGDAITDLILTLFRVNNLVLGWGDRLAASFGLTSARWQVLGAIVFAERPQPVAWLARDLGANRQNVQRIVNDLHKEGLVVFEPNPHHRRAQLVVLTKKGQRAYDGTLGVYYPKVNALVENFSVSDIKTAHRILVTLREKLEGDNDAEEQA